MVKQVHAPLQIRLTEPVIYLRGPSTGVDFRGRPQHVRDGQQAMVRGLLTLRLTKTTRIRSITVSLEGKSRTEWPEGIGPKRTDTYEENECINEKITFFSAQDAIKDRAARRSQSVDPSGWTQQDLDSDEDDWSSGDELPSGAGSRGRALPRGAMPRHSGDWTAWQQHSVPLVDSPGPSRALSRQVSIADNGVGRSESGVGLDGLRLDGRESGSPALPPQSPPISSHPSSILLQGGAGSRGRSPMTSQPVDMPRRASDRTPEEWQPSTPTGEPENPVYPPADGDSPTSPAAAAAAAPIAGGVRFQSDAELEAQHAAAMQQASDAEARPNQAASLHSVDSAGSGDSSGTAAHGASEYHPINDATVICPTNAVPTPTETPPPGSPMLAARQDSSSTAHTNGSAVGEAVSRPASHHVPSQSSLLRHGGDSPNLGPSQPNAARQSSLGGSSSMTHNASPGSPHTGSQLMLDDRGRQKLHQAHKFSLAAALRSLSMDVKERVRHSSRPPSRPGSRASSRTRGTETPRNLQFEESPGMSRTSSQQNGPIRAAVNDLLPHAGRSGRSSRAPSPTRDGRNESRGRSRRTRKDKDEELDETHKWKDFRKGVYNYPIAFAIPPNAPPTIHAEFGNVTYRLKATVVRVGALTSNLVEEKEITMIAGPQEDDTEETENVIVERQWEDQMRYLISLSGKAFPIGGVIPISIRLMPLTKCKVYRITVSLEEKTDYFAIGRKVARHETPRRYILFAAKSTDRRERPEPLLPIMSEAEDACKNSPLAPLARAAATNNPLEFSEFIDPIDNIYASLIDPIGPWHFEKDLHVPDCSARIKFTTKHESTNISVGHFLKVTIRVERGDDKAIDSKGRRKQFDIIIETPVKILDCRVNVNDNSLPSYDRASTEPPHAAGCSIHAKKDAPTILRQHPLIGSGLSHTVLNTLSHPGQVIHRDDSPAPPHMPHGHGLKEHDDTLLERNIVYDRLVSGQETETGEEPPTYKEAVAHAIRSASRAASRSGSRAPSRSQSRAPSRRASPTRGPGRNVSSGGLYIAE